MATPRIRLELIADDGVSTATARRWSLVADGTPSGWLEALRVDDRVELRMCVEEAARRRGIARSAVGRVLGLAPFGHAVQYVIRADAGSPALAAVARACGFRPGPDDDSADWVRAAPRPRAAADDITRFLDSDGRIDRYPLRDADRRALLTWVAVRAVPEDAVVDEPALNALLAPYAPAGDVAVLRRYLVDHELLERTRSGSQYARVTG